MNNSYFKAKIVPIIGEITNMVYTHGIATHMEAMKPAHRRLFEDRKLANVWLRKNGEEVRAMLDGTFVGLRG